MNNVFSNSNKLKHALFGSLMCLAVAAVLCSVLLIFYPATLLTFLPQNTQFWYAGHWLTVPGARSDEFEEALSRRVERYGDGNWRKITDGLIRAMEESDVYSLRSYAYVISKYRYSFLKDEIYYLFLSSGDDYILLECGDALMANHWSATYDSIFNRIRNGTCAPFVSFHLNTKLFAEYESGFMSAEIAEKWLSIVPEEGGRSRTHSLNHH